MRRTDGNRAARQLVDTAIELAAAAHRLRALRRSALSGGRYSAREYDRAVLAYRHAERQAHEARRLRRRSQEGQPLQAA